VDLVRYFKFAVDMIWDHYSAHLLNNVCIAIILGKTTFLNDVHRANIHSIYIRQYHKIRPYIKVTSIPNFDPTEVSNEYIYSIIIYISCAQI